MISGTSRRGFERFADARSEERQRKAFETHAGIAKRAGATLDRDAWMKAHPRGSIEYAEAFGPSGHLRPMDPRPQADAADRRHDLHARRAESRPDDHDRRGQPHGRTGGAQLGRSRGRARTRAKLAAPFFTLQEIINAAQVEIGKIGVAQKTERAAARLRDPEFVRRLQFLTSFDKLALIEADGPLWYRGLATLPDDQQPAVEALFQRHGASAS